MAFVLDVASLGACVSAATFERALDIYRRQGVLDYRLAAASASEWHIDGEVRGSERDPYESSVRLELAPDGRVLDFYSDCSCPVGQDCKHTVALALKAAYKAGAVRGSTASPTASRPAPPAPQAVLAQWLDLFDPVPPAPADRGGSSPDQPVYLLSSTPGGVGVAPRLMLGWRLSRPLKRGGWAKPKAPGYDAAYRIEALRDGSPGDDRECVRLIHSLGLERYSYGQNINGAVLGQAGLLALQLAAGTGRLFVPDAQGGIATPLRWGPPRTLGWRWASPSAAGAADPLWTLQPVLDGAPPPSNAEGPRLFAGPPALYLDPQASECGLAQAPGIEPQHLALLLTAPPIPQSSFADAQPQLLQRLAGLPLPPAVKAARAWSAGVPTPWLRLAPVPRDERPQRGLLVATLSFDYGGLRGHWPGQEAHVLTDHAGERVLLARDLPAELAARRRLDALNLLGDSLGRYHHVGSAAWLDCAGQDWAPLRDAGFGIECDPALDDLFRQADALQLSLDAPPGADTADDPAPGSGALSPWFDLSLGIEVDGVRQNVLPWLPGLLSQVVDTPDGPRLPEWLWRAQPDGRWLRLPSAPLAPWLRALLDLVDDRPARDLEADALRLSRGEALRLSAGEAATWEGSARLHEVLRQLDGHGRPPEVLPPAGLQAELRPYQREGLSWLQFLRRHALGGVLADDMGLGKTLQTLAHLLKEKEDGRLDAPCLVLAPVSLLGTWRREAARFAPGLRTRVWHGGERHAGAFAEGCDLLIAPYSLLQRDRERWLAQHWHVVVLDEAQHIKNASTHAAQVAGALLARQRIALSGTPMENHLGELWSLFHFLMPGFLGSTARFKQVFRTPIEKQGDTERLAQLRRRVAPFMLRRTKEAVATELPPRIESVAPVALEGAQADLYETIRLSTEHAVREALNTRGLARSQIQVLDALLKLRQVCCDPRLLKSLPGGAGSKPPASAKLALLMELLGELLAEGRRVLVFSQFTSMLTLIEDELRAAGHAWTKLTGETRLRDDAIARFTGGEVPIFLISLKAGGTGLNLPEADTVIHYDPWWNPAVEAQATARAHRIGQTKQVMVYRLVAEGTIEERMLALQARKAALAQGLLGGGAPRDAVLFTEEDVTELLKPLG
ncbi:RNA polymerase-associated protein RapA [Xylophilus ampelinus]|nr:helicase SNF2 [Variovorax sp.]VTY39249.1 RNA polymerase-associated protein RapA [Xylophilus ampelinus]